MARNFRRSHTAQPIAELNVTNLIDLGFMLLIIFMVVAPMMQEQQIALKLPSEAKSPQDKPDPTLRTETVSVDAKGNYYLNNKPISFPELQVQLRAFAKEPKQPNIRIAGDVAGKWGEGIAILAEMKKLNLKGAYIVTEAPP